MFLGIRIAASCAVLLCLAAPAAGQGGAFDFEYRKGSDPLLGFGNAAALAGTDADISEVRLTFDKDNGGLIPLWGSDDSWAAGAATESYKRVSDRLVFSGKLGYEYYRGLHCGGQILLDPADNPVNFLEEDLSTRGTKVRESYYISGGLSYNFGGRWSAGLLIDYKAADRNKFKDPRFRNILMDLSLAPGFWYSADGRGGFGANLVYEYRVEQLKSGLYGTVDREYDILVDQGGFFGLREDFIGDIGYVSVDNIRPLVSSRYGLAAQFVSGSTDRFSGELKGVWRSGHFGQKSSNSVVFCEFSGPEAELSAQLELPRTGLLHKIRLEASYRNLSNYTNTYKYETQDGHSTRIIYLAQNQTLSRHDLAGSLSYALHLGTGGFLPKWVLSARADAVCRMQQTVIYPYYRNSDFFRICASLEATRNIDLGRSVLGIGASAAFATGGGNPRADGKYAGGETKAKSFDDYLNRQFEYDTAPRAGAGINLKYSWTAFSGPAPYIRVSDSFTTLLSAPEYLDGRFVNIVSVALGCSF